MMILIIHHTSGLTWINVRTESIRISYTHFIIQIVCGLAGRDNVKDEWPVGPRKRAIQGALNSASSVASCSSMGARSRLTIRCSGVARRAPWLSGNIFNRP